MLLSLLLSVAVGASAAPRLLVVVSVDQMRAAYLKREHKAGLARLLREGFVFSDARHLHMPTETGPGHSVILTGRESGAAGIVGNSWYEHRAGRTVYCVEDSVHGRGPENLRVYALGDVLKARDPESKVVAVAGKDRAAILMGGKRPDAAIWYASKSKSYVTSSYYGTPGWLERFNREHPAPDPASTDADRAVLTLALEAARRFKLGRDDHPDILIVGFSATDYIGHRFGAESEQQARQIGNVDAVLGELLGELEDRVGKGRVALVLTADHGAPETVQGKKRILWDDMAASLERAVQHSYPSSEKWLVDYQFPNVYFNRALARSLGLDWRIFLRAAAKRIEKVDGIAKAYVPEELDAADPHAAVIENSVVPGRTGDLLLRLERDAFVTDPEDAIAHGSVYEYDASVPLVFWGEGVKAGASTETVRVADLAPTAASLLGLEFKPEPASRVLPVR
jgi:predicted AlkP superfamily pyrophosphatase or phosphodiesterase